MYINALAHYVPEQKVPNSYFESVIGLSDEWITSRTGIQERRKAAKGENTHTMAIESVNRLTATLPYPLKK